MLTASLLLAALLSANAESDPTIPLPDVWEKIPLPEVIERKPTQPKPQRPDPVAKDPVTKAPVATDETSDDRYGTLDDRYGIAEDRYAAGDQADRYAVPIDPPASAASPTGPIIQPPEPMPEVAPVVAQPVVAQPVVAAPKRQPVLDADATRAAAPQKFQPAPDSVSLPDKVDAFKPSWPVEPASANEPAPPAPSADPGKPWLPLTASLLALVASLAANVYLGWVWLGTRHQYRELAASKLPAR